MLALQEVRLLARPKQRPPFPFTAIGTWWRETPGGSSYPDGEWEWGGTYIDKLMLEYGDAHIHLEVSITPIRVARAGGGRFGKPVKYRTYAKIRWDYHTELRDNFYSFNKKTSFRSLVEIREYFTEWVFSQEARWDFEALQRQAYEIRRVTCVYRKEGEEYKPFCSLYPYSSKMCGGHYLPIGEYYMIDLADGREHDLKVSHWGWSGGGVRGFLNLHRWDGLRHGFWHARRHS